MLYRRMQPHCHSAWAMRFLLPTRLAGRAGRRDDLGSAGAGRALPANPIRPITTTTGTSKGGQNGEEVKKSTTTRLCRRREIISLDRDDPRWAADIPIPVQLVQQRESFDGPRLQKRQVPNAKMWQN